ncbi:MAG: hypothetical protein CME63_09220 [Halobacteriovoraceae bacterium]|nr:hypothetical protein [Halobacteriovoraceae bacterium]|tara:strand:+ start:115408 stop:115980 length:573 start_codon:yes stop_codon:yes gene_type:complete
MGIIKDFPFNMNYSYGEDLREVPDDAVAMKRGLEWLQDQLIEIPEEDKVQQTILLSQISGFARIIGDLDLAEQSLIQAIELLKDFKREDQIFAMKLRLAIVYQYRESFTKAERIYSDSLKAIGTTTDSRIKKYHDFVFQHYGKLKYDQGFYKEALDFFMRAYEERIIKGDLELVSSTEFAIAQTRKKLEL